MCVCYVFLLVVCSIRSWVYPQPWLLDLQCVSHPPGIWSEGRFWLGRSGAHLEHISTTWLEVARCKLILKRLPFKNLDFPGNKVKLVFKKAKENTNPPTKPSQCLTSLYCPAPHRHLIHRRWCCRLQKQMGDIMTQHRLKLPFLRNEGFQNNRSDSL